MNIIVKTKELNLPLGEYVVFGSGIMGALGIRDVEDIDLIVSPQLFDELRKTRWKYSEVEFEGRMRQRLSQGIAEAYKDFWYGGIDADTAQMISDAQIIEGVPFLPLREVIKIKRAFNRPKDQNDIVLIEQYLKGQT